MVPSAKKSRRSNEFRWSGTRAFAATVVSKESISDYMGTIHRFHTYKGEDKYLTSKGRKR